MKPSSPLTHLIGVALLSGIFGCQIAKAEDWPYFRGPNHNGILDTKLELIDEPQEVWRVDDLGTGHRGAAAIVGGRLYINGGRPADRSEPFLHCLDADTGKPIWKSRAGRTHSTPAVHDGMVYVQGDRLIVRCFDAANGNEVWSGVMPASTEHRGWGHSGSPRVWNDLLIVNYGYGAALDLKTGKPAWKFDGFAGLATPVIFTHRNRPAVAIFSGDKMIARDARSGDELWSIPWVTKSGVNASDPIFLDNDSKVFLSSRYGLGRSLYDIASGEPKELWALDGGATYSSSVYLDGRLYSLDGSLGRLDLVSGKKVSRGPTGNSVLVVGDQFICLGGGGELRMGTITDDRYSETVRVQLLDGQTWNTPAYSNGRLYVRNQNGVLLCVRIGNEL